MTHRKREKETEMLTNSWRRVVRVFRKLETLVLRVWDELNFIADYFSGGLVGDDRWSFKTDILMVLVIGLPINLVFIMVTTLFFLLALAGVNSFWVPLFGLILIVLIDAFFVSVTLIRYWVNYRFLPWLGESIANLFARVFSR